MDQNDLDKISRINLILHNITALVVKEGVSTISGYRDTYKNYFMLIEPIISRYPIYSLEFNAVIKPDMNHNQIVLAFVSLGSFLDSIIKQETLGSRTQVDQFKNEFFIDENKPFSAHKTISDIINGAVISLKIIDNYLEASSLDFFHIVNTKVEINILSMMLKPNNAGFKVALSKFLTEWNGMLFEVKISNFFHDRYIIIDNMEVWHVGPSLNRLGIKPAMISKVTDTDISNHIIVLFDKQWITAGVI